MTRDRLLWRQSERVPLPPLCSESSASEIPPYASSSQVRFAPILLSRPTRKHSADACIAVAGVTVTADAWRASAGLPEKVILQFAPVDAPAAVRRRASPLSIAALGHLGVLTHHCSEWQ